MMPGLNINNTSLSRGCRLLKIIADRGGLQSKCKVISKADYSTEEWLKDYLQYGFDPFRTYGIKLTECPDPSDSSPPNLWRETYSLLRRLQSRELVGKEARKAAKKLLGSMSSLHQSALFPLFNKDVKIGLQASSINKIYPGLVPTFGCQLADRFDSVKDLEGQIRDGDSRWWVEPKFDGMRCLLICDPDNPRALSRNGRELPLKVARSLTHVVMDLIKQPVVIDCEVYASDWSTSMAVSPGAKKSKKNSDDITFWAFDSILLTDFSQGRSSEPLHFRRARLESILAEFKTRIATLKEEDEDPDDDGYRALTRFVRATKRYPIRTMGEADRYAEAFRKKGLEGAVLKRTDAPYNCKRTKDWVKLVVEERGDYEVIGVKKGRGRNKGRMGALWLDIDGVRCKCGTGFSDKLRSLYWRGRKKIIGRIVEVMFREKTKKGKGKSKAGGKMRFPVFVRLRPDKD